MTAPTYLLTDPARRDVATWNEWRRNNPGAEPDLRAANLRAAVLRGAYLSGAVLRGAYLSGAVLRGASLSGAVLRGANLSGAVLRGADLYGADLRGANLYGADLTSADLTSATLTSATLSGADLSDADLRGAVGVSHPDAVAAVPVGSGHLCSALRTGDTVKIWAGCETFDSIDACRARILELGGEHQADRNAWLNWVETRLGGES